MARTLSESDVSAMLWGATSGDKVFPLPFFHTLVAETIDISESALPAAEIHAELSVDTRIEALGSALAILSVRIEKLHAAKCEKEVQTMLTLQSCLVRSEPVSLTDCGRRVGSFRNFA